MTSIEVVAIELGIYKGKRRRAGSTFYVEEDRLSPWMLPVKQHKEEQAEKAKSSVPEETEPGKVIPQKEVEARSAKAKKAKKPKDEKKEGSPNPKVKLD